MILTFPKVNKARYLKSPKYAHEYSGRTTSDSLSQMGNQQKLQTPSVTTNTSLLVRLFLKSC